MLCGSQSRVARTARRQIPALIRVEHDGDVGADRLPDHADALGVGLGREARHLHLDGAIAVLEVHRRLAPKIVRALAVAIVEAGDVGGHARAKRAAHQRVHGPVVALPMRSHSAMSMALMAVTSWRRCWRASGRDAAHARVGEGEEILPDALDTERILAHDERRDALEDLVDRAHALRTALGQERPVRLADPDEAGIGREGDDELAHPADRRGGGADRLWQGRGQEVRVERFDFHRRLRGDDTLRRPLDPFTEAR